MTTNTPADDAWKNVEENPEATDATPEVDENGEPINRYDGEMVTETDGLSVSDLMANIA